MAPRILSTFSLSHDCAFLPVRECGTYAHTPYNILPTMERRSLFQTCSDIEGPLGSSRSWHRVYSSGKSSRPPGSQVLLDEFILPLFQAAFRYRFAFVSSVREPCDEASLPRLLLVGNHPAPNATNAITTTETTTAQKRTFMKSPNAISIPDHQPFLIEITTTSLLGVYCVPHDSSCQAAGDERRGTEIGLYKRGLRWK